MLETKTFQPSVAYMVRSLFINRLEVSRLIAAAVVNAEFCNLLLKDPASALEDGYQDETFSFSETEKNFIGSIQADSLSGFAAQLSRSLNWIDASFDKLSVQSAEYIGY
jgi:hypothetical protein